MTGTDRAWERFGRTEPYFGVLADRRYAGATLSEGDREAFFASGASHVDWVLGLIDSVAGPVKFSRVLDFGCGVGRLVIPFALRAGCVVGSDISPAMLAEAQRNLSAAGVANARLVNAEEPLDGQFDLVHSYIVFQHIPRARGWRIVEALIDRIAPGGCGALHFLCAIDAPLWWRIAYWARWYIPLVHPLANIVQGAPVGRPFMQMNVYPIASILDLLRRKGCGGIHVEKISDGRYASALFLFRKQP